MTKLPSVSIIIVTYNHEHLLEKCLSFYHKYTAYKNYDIIIVDNSSEQFNYTKKYAKKKGITVVRTNQNLGWGRACNRGAKESKADYVFFSNDDVYPKDKDWLDILVKKSEQGKRTIYSPMLYLGSSEGFIGLKNQRYTKSIAGINIKKEKIGKTEREIKKNMKDQPEYPLVNLGMFLMKRKLYNSLGGYNDLFFLYYEDTELGLRAKNNKLAIRGVPQSFMFADKNTTVATVFKERKKKMNLRVDATANLFRGILMNYSFIDTLVFLPVIVAFHATKNAMYFRSVIFPFRTVGNFMKSFPAALEYRKQYNNNRRGRK